MSKIKVIEAQGFPHTLTQADGTTLRLFARQSKVIDEKLVSPEIKAEAQCGFIILMPVKDEETKTTKARTK